MRSNQNSWWNHGWNIFLWRWSMNEDPVSQIFGLPCLPVKTSGFWDPNKIGQHTKECGAQDDKTRKIHGVRRLEIGSNPCHPKLSWILGESLRSVGVYKTTQNGFIYCTCPGTFSHFRALQGCLPLIWPHFFMLMLNPYSSCFHMFSPYLPICSLYMYPYVPSFSQPPVGSSWCGSGPVDPPDMPWHRLQAPHGPRAIRSGRGPLVYLDICLAKAAKSWLVWEPGTFTTSRDGKRYPPLLKALKLQSCETNIASTGWGAEPGCRSGRPFHHLAKKPPKRRLDMGEYSSQ